MQFLFYSLVAFISGILSFLAPCSLPIMPAYFAHHAKVDKKELVKSTLFFGLGIATLFVLFGVLAGSFGKFLLIYKREVVLVSSIVLIIFGIMTFFGINIIKSNFDSKSSFLFGSVVGMTWSGCLGPVLGIILVMAANSGTAFAGGLLLLLYSLGLVFPLIILAFFAEKIPDRFWKKVRGKEIVLELFNKKFYFHTINMLSGSLFILFGLLLISNASTYLSAAFSPFIEKLFDLETMITTYFRIR